jgi:hypothetical protein
MSSIETIRPLSLRESFRTLRPPWSRCIDDAMREGRLPRLTPARESLSFLPFKEASS